MFKDNELDNKAKEYQKIIEDHIVQKNGMIPMLVKPGTFELPTAEDYKGAYSHRHLKGKTEEELGLPPMYVWRAWENTSANTGFYLGALSYQYRCTRDQNVLNMCSRTLKALEYIYNLGVENGRPGFMCKPYGGVYTNQTAGDQVQCIVSGLAAYMDIAPKEDYDIIKKIVIGMAEWELKINFIPPAGSYFAWEFDEEDFKKTLYKDWTHALIYIPLLYLAWYFTGNKKYVQEISQWYNKMDCVYPIPPDKGIIKGYGHLARPLYLASTAMKMDPLRQDIWRSIIAYYFKVQSTGITSDGMIYTGWEHNLDTGITIPNEGGLGNTCTKTGRSAIIARGLVDAQQWFEGDDMAEKAYYIISRMGLNECRFVASVSGEKPLPESWQIEEKLLDMDSLISWLWTYWEGKWFRYW